MRPPKPSLDPANVKRLSDMLMNTIISDTSHNLFEALAAMNEITASLIHCKSEYSTGLRLHFALEFFKIALDGHEEAAKLIAKEEAEAGDKNPT